MNKIRNMKQLISVVCLTIEIWSLEFICHLVFVICDFYFPIHTPMLRVLIR